MKQDYNVITVAAPFNGTITTTVETQPTPTMVTTTALPTTSASPTSLPTSTISASIITSPTDLPLTTKPAIQVTTADTTAPTETTSATVISVRTVAQPITTQSPSQTQSAKEWNEIGVERYNATDYSGALKAFSAALTIDPNDETAQIGKQYAQEALSGDPAKKVSIAVRNL